LGRRRPEKKKEDQRSSRPNLSSFKKKEERQIVKGEDGGADNPRECVGAQKSDSRVFQGREGIKRKGGGKFNCRLQLKRY